VTEAQLNDGTRLASMRTSMSFQRTRMSADRTLMSSLRTSLSMIGFGFTISSVFQGLRERELLGPHVPENAGGLFGLALIVLGILVLLFAIVAERRYMIILRRQRDALIADGLLTAEEPFPRSFVMVLAILLLLVGLLAVWIIATAVLG